MKNSKPAFATYVGLFLALGVPILIFPTRILYRALHLRVGIWTGEAVIWGLATLVLCILLFFERLPLSTIGLSRPNWKSLLWGIGGAVAVRLAAAVTLILYAQRSGVSPSRAFAHDFGTATRLGALPFGILLFLAVSAAVTEEILFRGYGIERLAAVSGSRILSALVCLAIFTVAHLGTWDLQYLVVVFPAGLVLTVLYLWRRDLWANIYAHFFTDALGLAVAYAIAHRLIPFDALSATS